MTYKYLVFVVAIVIYGCTPVDDKSEETAKAIRQEATMPSNSPLGNPLPLAGHWNTGLNPNGFSPEYQLKMIAEGHYLLPWFRLVAPQRTDFQPASYEQLIRRTAKLNLPISFISTQWERVLSEYQHYCDLPPQDNPNLSDENKQIIKKLSPFGPEKYWYSAGNEWGNTKLLRDIQLWYPGPPLVLFVSNNEHPKMSWYELYKYIHFNKKQNGELSDSQKKEIVGNGWIERYRALINGFKDGLQVDSWKVRSRFIGYSAFGPRALGRWHGWAKYSLEIPERISPWPFAWDGASVSYYLDRVDNAGKDYTVRSPQLEAMNWVFMREEAGRHNPNYWFEISTWDGNQFSDNKVFLSGDGLNRYEGFVQFGMWLLRPRVVREFRNHLSTLEEHEKYFRVIIRSVDRVHHNDILKKFWRRGRLLANTSYNHPYQIDLSNEYLTKNRWFLLNTSIDPPRPWDLQTKIPVFSLALVVGEFPNREWLVFAYSPLQRYNNIEIDIPEYKKISINTTTSGSFFYLDEKDKNDARQIL